MASTLRLFPFPLFIVATFALMFRQVEPFATFFYLFAWYGLILSFDQFIAAREGRSLIARCGRGFPILMFWSTVVWFLFELINFRLVNWYYVFVPDQPIWRYSNTLLAFATVFPGIFWIDHYLALRGVGQSWHGRSRHFSPSLNWWLRSIGLLFLVLPLIFPTYFFPFVWLALIFILAPAEYARDADSLLHQLERGDFGPLFRLLLAGLVAGFFWEFFNFWAQAKWIYTVPFFDELKLFEMPVAGFLGFPPFAVECAMLYRLLVYHRLAPRFGSYQLQHPRPTMPRIGKLVAFVAAALFAMGVHLYMDRLTVASVTPRVSKIEALDVGTKESLRAADVHYLTQLQGAGSDRVWMELRKSLSEKQATDLSRLAELYLHQGIGVESGNALVRAGVTSIQELAQLTAEQLHERLIEADSVSPSPSVARLQVWVRRASRGT